MKTQHTPGPWTVRQLSYRLAVMVEKSPSNRLVVCEVAETATEADEPDRAPFDAKLIASAPALLEALIRAVDDQLGDDWKKDARAAIKAATE